MGKVLFLSPAQFKKRFPNAKKAKTPNSKPRPTFRNPVHFQIRFPEWAVCQGFSKTHGPFAWVECNGKCLDLSAVSDQIYFSIIVGRAPKAVCAAYMAENTVARAEFYKERGIAGVRRYTKEESRKNLNKYGNYGIWKE
jgi:hypothetical protein